MKRCHGVGLHNVGYIAVGSVMSDQRAEIALLAQSGQLNSLLFGSLLYVYTTYN